ARGVALRTMNSPTLISEFLSTLFPEAGAELLTLYQSAADNAGLTASDFYTLVDLVDLSGYRESESLHAFVLTLLLALEEGSLCVEASEAGFTRRLGDLVDDK